MKRLFLGFTSVMLVLCLIGCGAREADLMRGTADSSKEENKSTLASLFSVSTAETDYTSSGSISTLSESVAITFL